MRERGDLATIWPSAAITAAMLLAALITNRLAGINSAGLVADYVLPTALVSLLIAAAYGLIRRVRAVERDASLFAALRTGLRARGALLLLPALLMPLFLAGFTGAKSAIYRLVGYSWDVRFAAMDRAIFGQDPWLLTHAVLGDAAMPALELVYVSWGGVLVVAATLVAVAAPRAFVGRFFLAMMLTWFLGGFAMAYLTSAAGPVFAHRFGGGDGFLPLVHLLDRSFSADSAIRFTQDYLLAAYDADVAVKGGGISAMPSIHVAAATVLLLAARRALWLWPALLFFLVIAFGSVHLGYHYAVDGMAGALIALGCWAAAALPFGRQIRRPASAPILAAA